MIKLTKKNNKDVFFLTIIFLKPQLLIIVDFLLIKNVFNILCHSGYSLPRHLIIFFYRHFHEIIKKLIKIIVNVKAQRDLFRAFCYWDCQKYKQINK